MSKESPVVLRNHKLYHLPEIKVNENIFQSRFLPGCATARCKANCCKDGVWVDLAERDKILAHADLIQLSMEAHQEKNPAHWFEPVEQEDLDFPSGRAVGTQVYNGACVFLDSAGHCVLQKASQKQTGWLKPFFCTAFPVTIEDGELLIDDGKDSRCCTVALEGPLTVFEVCREELIYVLGEEGFAALQLIDKTRQGAARGQTLDP